VLVAISSLKLLKLRRICRKQMREDYAVEEGRSAPKLIAKLRLELRVLSICGLGFIESALPPWFNIIFIAGRHQLLVSNEI
jgi:hypothetical protein